MMKIIKTDKLFQNSPDAGEPECICSRCGEVIDEEEIPIRAFVDDFRGGKYRYHPHCFFESEAIYIDPISIE